MRRKQEAEELERAYLDVDLLTRSRVGLSIDGGLSVLGGLVGHDDGCEKKKRNKLYKNLHYAVEVLVAGEGGQGFERGGIGGSSTVTARVGQMNDKR